MLRRINSYSHGFVFVPVVIALKNARIFRYLSESEPQSLSSLTCKFKANSGYLKASLDMLHVVGWLDVVDGKYSSTEKMEDSKYVPVNLAELYDFAPEYLVSNKNSPEVLTKWFPSLIDGWGCSQTLSEMLDGVVLIPLLLGLVRSDLVQFLNISDTDRLPFWEELRHVFIAKKWANVKDGKFKVSGVGKFMLKHCHSAGVTASYRPMLSKMKELLFGNSNKIIGSEQGLERHVDRTLNVQSSAFQHAKYFKEIERAISLIFNDSPLNEQPNYIVDMGCGNGSLLNSIYNIIKEKTVRGSHLLECPIVLVGIDLNSDALVEAAGVLKDLPHKLLHGDINEPEDILATMKREGVDDTSKMLHVRSFLDHNRNYYDSWDIDRMNPWSLLPSESFGIKTGGKLIPFSAMMQNLSTHLNRWSLILGEYGLLCLDVHYQTYWSKKEYSDTSEGFHFDALHAFSKQYLCEPEYFVAAMAENGLFSEHFFSGFPRNFDFTRITLGYYEKKKYAIRFIRREEIDDICSLNVIGDDSLGKEKVQDLLHQNPELCFLLEVNGGSPEAVFFCRREETSVPSKYEAVVDTVFCKDVNDSKPLEHLFVYALQYMTLKCNISSLKGRAHKLITPILIDLGAKPSNGSSLKSDDLYLLRTEN